MDLAQIAPFVVTIGLAMERNIFFKHISAQC